MLRLCYRVCFHACVFCMCFEMMLMTCQERKFVSCSRCAGHNRDTDRESIRDKWCVPMCVRECCTLCACLSVVVINEFNWSLLLRLSNHKYNFSYV